MSDYPNELWTMKRRTQRITVLNKLRGSDEFRRELERHGIPGDHLSAATAHVVEQEWDRTTYEYSWYEVVKSDEG